MRVRRIRPSVVCTLTSTITLARVSQGSYGSSVPRWDLQHKDFQDQVWHKTRNVFDITDDAEHRASVDRQAQKALCDWKNDLVE